MSKPRKLYLGRENSAPISAPAQMQGTLGEIQRTMIRTEDKEKNVVSLQLEKGMVVKYLSAFHLNLDFSGIQFKNATLELELGMTAYKILQKEILKYKRSYKERLKKHPIESDDFLTFMIPRFRKLELAYEPVIRHFSTATILLVSSAEIYICDVASVKLQGKKLDQFYRLPLNKKWEDIETIFGLKNKLIHTKEPLKSFVELVKQRNKLIHFKGLKANAKTLEIPNFISDLHLTPKECINNLNCVASLIIKFNLNWKGAYGPNWLYLGHEQYRNPCFYYGNPLTSMSLG